ncbi:hypothetical protein IKO50_00460 [bacterium]|nr:hypothetical protein [bacterium]
MVENIDNNIDNIHKIKKSETPNKDFDEEKNIEQSQAIIQEREEAKRKQREEAERLVQRNFDNANPINENIKPQQIEEESQ